VRLVRVPAQVGELGERAVAASVKASEDLPQTHEPRQPLRRQAQVLDQSPFQATDVEAESRGEIVHPEPPAVALEEDRRRPAPLVAHERREGA
jgi:hypothetical protein